MVYNRTMILIVDDDETICELVSESLKEDAYLCDIALTAEEALSKLQSHHFDLVLLDIKLPGKSGMELLTTFRTLSQDTNIIMMTAINDLDIAIQAMKLGASDYIVKPFTNDKLRATINTTLESSGGRQSGFSTIQPTENINKDNKTANISRIIAIACGVDAQIDHFDFHSKIVTEKTMDIAQRLGLPKEEINNWVAARDELHSQRDGYIECMLTKLKRYPVAQLASRPGKK